MIKEYKDIFIAIIIALILFGLAYTIFDIRQSILVGTVAFLVTLWTNEALPLGLSPFYLYFISHFWKYLI